MRNMCVGHMSKCQGLRTERIVLCRQKFDRWLFGRWKPCFVVLACVFGVDTPSMVDFKLPLWVEAGKSFLWCKLSPSTPMASAILLSRKGCWARTLSQAHLAEM